MKIDSGYSLRCSTRDYTHEHTITTCRSQCGRLSRCLSAICLYASCARCDHAYDDAPLARHVRRSAMNVTKQQSSAERIFTYITIRLLTTDVNFPTNVMNGRHINLVYAIDHLFRAKRQPSASCCKAQQVNRVPLHDRHIISVCYGTCVSDAVH